MNKNNVEEEKLFCEEITSDFGYFLKNTTIYEDFYSFHQHIQILNSPTFGNILRLDSIFQCSENDEFFYHEPLVHMAMLSHPNPKRVLVIGGGDGGAAEEVLKHPHVQLLDHVEIDIEVIRLSIQYLESINKATMLKPDSRYRLIIADALLYISQVNIKYDVIILDLTDPGVISNALYSSHFYRLCCNALTDDGVMSLHLAAPWLQTANCLKCIEKLHPFFKNTSPFLVNVPILGGQWLMALCTKMSSTLDERTTLFNDEYQARFEDLTKKGLKLLTPEYLLSLRELPLYLKQLF